MHTSILHRQRSGTPIDSFVIESERPLSRADMRKIGYVLHQNGASILRGERRPRGYVTVGPRLTFATPESANGSSIFRSIDVPVVRIERFEHTRLNRMPQQTVLKGRFDKMTQEIYPRLPVHLSREREREVLVTVPVLRDGAEALERASLDFGIGLTDLQCKRYAALFMKKGRDPTLEELFFLPSFNSDHSRHLQFNARIKIDGVLMPYTLFELVKAAHKLHPGISTVAFSDNASAQYGSAPVPLFLPHDHGGPSPVWFVLDDEGEWVMHALYITGKVETHNFPTSIVPFAGAATGIGGLLRDLYAIGLGGYPGVALWTGICVGALDLLGRALPGQRRAVGDGIIADPTRIFIEAMKGATDYANASGHPAILWELRSFEQEMPWGERTAFRKPGMFAGGMGRVLPAHAKKQELGVGMLAIRFGGPTFNLGFGGATASSVDQSASSSRANDNAVQRGDPEMGRRTFCAMNAAVARLKRNPFHDLHDQGAGGVGNLFAELVSSLGATLDLGKLNLGDPAIRRVEKLLGESQEGFGVAIKKEDLPVLAEICARERVPLEVLGEIDGTGVVRFVDSTDGTTVVELTGQEMRDAVGDLTIEATTVLRDFMPLRIPNGLSVATALSRVFRYPGVGSDAWATTRGDSSVGGRVVQSHTCGPMLLPLSHVGVMADSHFASTGAAMAVGINYASMLIDPRAGVRMAFSDMYLRIAAAGISGAQDICIQGNWAWPASKPGEMARLYRAAESLSHILKDMASRLTGGKDSLSMSVKVNGETIAAPGTLALTGYAPVNDVRRVLTPVFPARHERIVSVGFVDLSRGKHRLGGSTFAQTLGQLGNECPDIEDPSLLRQAFEALQLLQMRGQVLAYHPRTAGGLAAALARMCLASGFGMHATLPEGVDVLPYLFNEEAGYVFAYDGSDKTSSEVEEVFERLGVPLLRLGGAAEAWSELVIKRGNERIFNEKIPTLRRWYERTSDLLSERDGNPASARREVRTRRTARPVEYKLPFTPTPLQSLPYLSREAVRPNAAVLREEGTNGHEEMYAALALAGFTPWNIHMSDIVEGRLSSLEQFSLLANPGGFSFKDVFGAGRGQAAVTRFNRKVERVIGEFYKRSDTLSLGVCNGNQYMQHLDVLPGHDRAENKRPYLGRNASARFESRWSTLRIYESPASATFFRGMEGAVLGIHVAHGEGRYIFPDKSVLTEVLEHNLAPVRFVDGNHTPTEAYPHNPNGSPLGIAGLCSYDGRHLGMMPHPERAVLPWQWVYMPKGWSGKLSAPWLRMFENACHWCLAHR